MLVVKLVQNECVGELVVERLAPGWRANIVPKSVLCSRMAASKRRLPPVVSHGRPPISYSAQPLRFAGASPSSKDSTAASVASASSEAATVRAPAAFDAASRSPFTDSRAST